MAQQEEEVIGLFRVYERVDRRYDVWAPRYHQVFWSLEDASKHIPPVGPALIITEGNHPVARYMDGRMMMGYVYPTTSRLA